MNGPTYPKYEIGVKASEQLHSLASPLLPRLVLHTTDALVKPITVKALHDRIREELRGRALPDYCAFLE